jgi:hypothetical protein
MIRVIKSRRMRPMQNVASIRWGRNDGERKEGDLLEDRGAEGNILK